MAGRTRPKVSYDANYVPTQDSSLDEKFRGEYDVNNNLIYKGLSRPGSATNSLQWQIAKLTYDVANNVTQIDWPQDSRGVASNDYIFSWNARAGYTYS